MAAPIERRRGLTQHPRHLAQSWATSQAHCLTQTGLNVSRELSGRSERNDEGARAPLSQGIIPEDLKQGSGGSGA